MKIKIFKFNICLFIILSLFQVNAWGQDKITRLNGEVIKCRIIDEDSINVYFSKTYKDYTVSKTYLPKDEIASVEYYKQTRDTFKTDILSLGFGMGLDYGGFGLNFQVKPIEDFAVFIGAGYALVDIGFTGGVKMNLHSKTNFNPFFMAMYGYNAGIKVENAPALNKVFYGPSLGLGFDYKFSSSRMGFFSASIIFPLRFKAREYMSKMENEYSAEMKKDFWPVLFSMGYHF